jgi:hypothetical protein
MAKVCGSLRFGDDAAAQLRQFVGINLAPIEFRERSIGAIRKGAFP